MNVTGNSFDDKAATWDVNPDRHKLMSDVWSVIEKNLSLAASHTVLDYGSGTGLMGYRFINKVKAVTFCDTSEGMLNEVAKKRDAYGYRNVKLLNSDFVNDPLPDEKFDLLVSMLVLHHIEKLDVLLAKFNQVLRSGGHFCWIDLDEEDGDFHSNNDGIAHFGFSQMQVETLLTNSGFKVKFFDLGSTYRKETANGERFFPIFVAIAQKQ